MADQKLNLTVQVNAETGQLEVLGAKFSGLGDAAKKAEGSFAGLTGQAGDLVKSFLPFATAGGIIAFFAGAVKGAEEENEAMRQLKFTLESNGQSWEANRGSITKWAQAIQSATRFSDSEALSTLQKLTLATGNLSQAQKASKLAIDLSVASGKSLGETTEFVNSVITGQERSVKMASKEFGAYTDGATTAQGVLDALGRHVQGAAEKEESLTKTQKQTSHAFEDFSKQIGVTILPAVQMFTAGLTGILKVVENLGTMIAVTFKQIADSVIGTSRLINAVLKGNFSEIKSIVSQTMTDLVQDIKGGAEQIVESWSQGQDKQTAATLKGTNERLSVNANALLKQRQEEQQAQNEREQKARENTAKLIQIEAELDRQIASFQKQGLARDKSILEAEVNQKKAAIEKEIKGEREKQAALAKLRDFEKAGTTNLMTEQVKIKQSYALTTADLAVQTLQTLNSLGDSGSAADRVRAKALLLLQQSIAIGWAVVAATKATAETGNPAIGGALLAAQIALIAVQTAAGFQQIDKAAAQQKQDLAGISINPPVPGIDLPPPGQGQGHGGGSTQPDTGNGRVGASSIVFNGDIVIHGVNDASKIPDSVVNAIGERLLEKVNGQGQVGLSRS